MPGALATGQKEAERILGLPEDEQKKALDEMIDKQQAAKKSLKSLMEKGASGTNTEVTKSEDGNVEIRQTIAMNGDGLEGQRMMMEMTSPEQRAAMDEFKELMQQRMEERGIDSDDGAIVVLGFESSGVSTSP